QPVTGRDDLLHVGQPVENRRETKTDTLERRLTEVPRGRLEGQPVDRPRRGGIPPDRALTPEKGQKCQAVLVGAALEHRALAGRQRLLQPGMEVAAVRERAPLDHPPLIEQVEEEARPRLGYLRLVE